MDRSRGELNRRSLITALFGSIAGMIVPISAVESRARRKRKLRSTDYTVVLTASDGSTTTIAISDSINPLPGSDTWSADETAMGTKGGAVSSWGTTDLHLTGPVGVNSVVLDGFTSATKKGDDGTGTKSYEEGTFPMGDLKWECTAKN